VERAAAKPSLLGDTNLASSSTRPPQQYTHSTLVTARGTNAIIFDSIGGGAMGQLLVRNIDDRTIERLRLRAELKGHSLEQELREIINQAAGPTVEERLAMIDRVRAMQKKPSKMLSEDVVRKLRDERIKRLTGRRS
jgi:plasmid stability protein